MRHRVTAVRKSAVTSRTEALQVPLRAVMQHIFEYPTACQLVYWVDLRRPYQKSPSGTRRWSGDALVAGSSRPSLYRIANPIGMLVESIQPAKPLPFFSRGGLVDDVGRPGGQPENLRTMTRRRWPMISFGASSGTPGAHESSPMIPPPMRRRTRFLRECSPH